MPAVGWSESCLENETNTHNSQLRIINDKYQPTSGPTNQPTIQRTSPATLNNQPANLKQTTNYPQPYPTVKQTTNQIS